LVCFLRFKPTRIWGPTEALARICAHYEIENEVRGKAADLRLSVRQAPECPLFEDARIWMPSAPFDQIAACCAPDAEGAHSEPARGVLFTSAQPSLMRQDVLRLISLIQTSNPPADSLSQTLKQKQKK